MQSHGNDESALLRLPLLRPEDGTRWVRISTRGRVVRVVARGFFLVRCAEGIALVPAAEGTRSQAIGLASSGLVLRLRVSDPPTSSALRAG